MVTYFKFSRDPATKQLLASRTAIGRVDQAASELTDQQKQLQGPGKQPFGSMNIYKSKESCSGYPSNGSIVIAYNFEDGRQQEDHPNPGAWYIGISRTAYLPDNKEGRTVCRLLKEAFRRRLIFTIGRSKTTGHEGAIILNDVHHKTNTQFGYPDPSYLARVTYELACKGVNEEQINTKERIEDFIEL